MDAFKNFFSCIKKGQRKLNSTENIKTTNVEKTTNISINPPKIKTHLICDDAPSIRLVLKKYLTLFGCKVDEAENGQVAIDKIKNGNSYNIIWMDIKMPTMDGFEATRYLKKEMNYENVIIGLTGYVDEETVRKCHELGMKHFVSKPFDKKVIQMYTEQY